MLRHRYHPKWPTPVVPPPPSPRIRCKRACSVQEVGSLKTVGRSPLQSILAFQGCKPCTQMCRLQARPYTNLQLQLIFNFFRLARKSLFSQETHPTTQGICSAHLTRFHKREKDRTEKESPQKTVVTRRKGVVTSNDWVPRGGVAPLRQTRSRQIEKNDNQPAGTCSYTTKQQRNGRAENQEDIPAASNPREFPAPLQAPPKPTNKQGHTHRANRQALGKQPTETTQYAAQHHKGVAKFTLCVAFLFPPRSKTRTLLHRCRLLGRACNRQSRKMQRGKPPAKGRDPLTLTVLIPYTHQQPPMRIESQTSTPPTHDRHLATRGYEWKKRIPTDFVPAR